MPVLLVFGLTGLFAQLVNGSLGMGFGVTTNTVLISSGITPAVASASIQIANMGTGLVSGASHWRFGNVSWPLVVRLGLPGAAGAFLGATLLSSLTGDWIVPAVAVVLLGLGGVVVVRSARGDMDRTDPDGRAATGIGHRFLIPLGTVGGFMNAIGGGGWGPVTTPALMASGRVGPRYVVGSVSAAEVMVTVSATVGFALGLAGEGLDLALVLALVAGGVVAAPFAAMVVGRVQPGRLGVAVGTLLLMLNARTLLWEAGLPAPVVALAVLVLATAGTALTVRVGRHAGSGDTGNTGAGGVRGADEVHPGGPGRCDPSGGPARGSREAVPVSRR